MTKLIGVLLIGLALLTSGAFVQAQAPNLPPVVTTNPDTTGFLCPPGQGLAYMQDVTITDDAFPGNPVSVSWEQLGGPTIALFSNRQAVKPIICFKRDGVYTFRLLVYDEQFLVFDDVQVTVSTIGAR